MKPDSRGITVEWYANPERAEELRRMARQQQEWGYPIRFIDDQELARLEPFDSAAATRLLLRRAQAAGANILYPHSGVTLGPLLGELAALELLDGVQVDILEPYRPARFAG